MVEEPNVLIIGGGPTGLGAALRLTELGCKRWTLLDAATVPGGLSRSFKDAAGFTWDVGGHVIFSHYQYFDDLMDACFPAEAPTGPDGEPRGWHTLQREAWVRISGVWVPYPFQLNIHRLPDADAQECLAGLEAVAAAPPAKESPRTFADYIHRGFGAGVARIFMEPYNFKVWAVPLQEMSAGWIGERVATVDITRIRRNMKTKEDDVGWGPNATFRFPKSGGTGSIYRTLKEKFLPPANCRFGDADGSSATRVTAVLPNARRARLQNGEELAYDRLVTTMPLDDLLRMLATGMEEEEKSAGAAGGLAYPFTPAQLRDLAGELVSNDTYVIGIGLRGRCPAHLHTTCWMYFPGPETPFYRATVLSNYASANVPAGEPSWSLMLEVNFTARFKPCTVTEEELVQQCLSGCVAADLLRAEDAASNVSSIFVHHERKGYPIPSIGRDALLLAVQPWLKSALGIYSRGRFGGWRYEVANQDHSLMQGVEAVDDILLSSAAAGSAADDAQGKDESARYVTVPWRGAETLMTRGEPTYHNPGLVNTSRGTLPCALARQH